jgi:hypothetical protein
MTAAESLKAIDEKLDTLPDRLAAALNGSSASRTPRQPSATRPVSRPFAGSQADETGSVESFDRLNRAEGFKPSGFVEHAIGRMAGVEFESDIQAREDEERQEEKEQHDVAKHAEYKRQGDADLAANAFKLSNDAPVPLASGEVPDTSRLPEYQRPSEDLPAPNRKAKPPKEPKISKQEYKRLSMPILPELGDIGITPHDSDLPSVAKDRSALPETVSGQSATGGGPGGLANEEVLGVLKDILEALQSKGGEKGSGSGKDLLGPKENKWEPKIDLGVRRKQ